MEKITLVIEWLKGDGGLMMLAALLAVSEFLSVFPKVKSNGVFQFIVNGRKWLKDLLFKK